MRISGVIIETSRKPGANLTMTVGIMRAARNSLKMKNVSEILNGIYAFIETRDGNLSTLGRDGASVSPSSFGTNRPRRTIKNAGRDETNSVTLTSLIAFVLEIPARNKTMEDRQWRPSEYRFCSMPCLIFNE